MAGGVGAIAGLLGKVSSANALVVSLDGGTASATTFRGGDGTAAAPTFTFTSDLTNGMYLSAADTLGFATAGVVRLTIGTTGFLLGVDGTNTTPTYGFATQPTSGFYLKSGDGGGTIVAAAVDVLRTTGAPSIDVRSDCIIRFSSDTTITSTADVLLKRGAAGLFAIQGASSVAGQMVLGATGGVSSAHRLTKKITGIADNTATDVLTVTVPNANHAAVIRLTFVSSNGSTDAFESSRTAAGAVVLARTAGVTTVATAATLTLTGIATVAAGATHTLAYGVTAMTGAAGATQTFTIQVTIDDSGNLGSNQVVVLAEVINAEATGVTIA